MFAGCVFSRCFPFHAVYFRLILCFPVFSRSFAFLSVYLFLSAFLNKTPILHLGCPESTARSLWTQERRRTKRNCFVKTGQKPKAKLNWSILFWFLLFVWCVCRRLWCSRTMLRLLLPLLLRRLYRFPEQFSINICLLSAFYPTFFWLFPLTFFLRQCRLSPRILVKLVWLCLNLSLALSLSCPVLFRICVWKKLEWWFALCGLRAHYSFLTSTLQVEHCSEYNLNMLLRIFLPIKLSMGTTNVGI